MISPFGKWRTISPVCIVIVEQAPVVYTQTEECDDIDDWLNVEELKSLDGILTTVLLPDGC